MKRFILLFFVITAFTLTQNIYAQSTPTVYIENITATPGTQVAIPIKFKDFTNIGAVGLKIIFDTNVLDFVSVTDNPTHGTFLTNTALVSLGGVHDTVAVTWFDVNPISFTDGNFAVINFVYKGGTSAFHLLPSPESSIGDQNATPINDVVFTDGSISQPQILNGSIGDYVWIDANGNGIQDNGELPFAGVTVNLLDAANGTQINTTTTNSSTGNNFIFSNVAPGTYKVQFIVPNGYVLSKKQAGGSASYLGDSDPDSLSGITDTVQIITGNLNRYDIDAGMHLPFSTPVLTGSIGDYVWIDSDFNGMQTQGELPLANVTVKLLNPNDNNTVLNTTTTDSQGLYSFTGVNAGTYKIQFVVPAGYVISRQHNGGSNSLLGDSDPDSLSGITDTVQIVSGNLNRYDIDAGMHLQITSPAPTGSIGDYAWEDTNSNGIQDQGELPLQGVTVKLLFQSTVAQTTLTDASGNYSFSNLSAGDYQIEFVLPAGYAFSPKNANSGLLPDGDSDADPAIGKTDVINLTAGENIYSVDAGMYIPAVVITNPVPGISINDGIDNVPDSGSTYTYSITINNTGNADLLNATVIDTIPSGLSYKSSTGGLSSGETTTGSNVVVFQVGTLGINSTMNLTLEVEVTGNEAEYKNKAELSGNDSNNEIYFADASDINYGSSTSGGSDAGVESRGDMAEALLRRQLRIQNGMTIPMIAKTGAANINSLFNLSDLVPAAGPYLSHPVETTPYDILGISNAISSYAVDYDLAASNGSRRVAGVFSTITPGTEIYDHTKAVCDRLAGSFVDEIKLVSINGYQFYGAKFVNSRKNVVDYAVSFSIYETAGGFYVQNKWTHNEYQAPLGTTNVYNFQVWSGSFENSIELSKGIISKFAATKTVNYLNTNQLNPETFISASSYTHDGKIHLTIINNGGSKQSTLNIEYRNSQGDNQISRIENLDLHNGVNDVTITTGIIADANLYLTNNGEFKDESYVSGGAYTYVSGPSSTVQSFNTKNYSQLQIGNFPDGSLVLSGGASVSGNLNDYVSVIKSLNTSGNANDLSNYSSIRFEASGTGVLDVLLIMTNTKNNNYYHYKINLSSSNNVYVISFNDFKELYGAETPFDAGKILDVGFQLSSSNNVGMNSFDFEVKNIAFYAIGSVTAVDDQKVAPAEFSLSQNYPNPFNPSTVIQFYVAKSEHISLTVYNLLGQQVAVLVDNNFDVGKHSVNFNASSLASGIYFYKLVGNSVNITKKMILMK